MVDDNLGNVWGKFFAERTTDLFHRFTGYYRAVVKETNDPLRTGRIRVLIPELHDIGLKAPDLPWATVAPWLGGRGCGSWHNAIIGDIVYVTFEKGHAYSPIVTGFADPTRRAFYPHQMVHGTTPITVDVQGKSTGKAPEDFVKEYLPKDERPMSTGFRDRYGSFMEMVSYGFIPFEHRGRSAATGTDGVTLGTFSTTETAPVKNDPDVKRIAMHTKYGHTMMMNDSGYDWEAEFSGKFDDDRSFEEERSKYLVKFFNEDKPKGRDQRRTEIRTRYGHKEEYRDVGWKKTRPGEYGDQKTVSDASEDERWMKWRTKGGHFFQMIDTGNDPDNDLYVKRLLKTEVNTFTEKEDQMGEDRRMMRWMTRYGFKMALDDRGSDKKDANNKETPRGNGFYVKGVRDGRGFGIEFNEKDSMNRMMLYSPKSKCIVLDDKHGRITICTDTSGAVSESVKPEDRTKDNHFATSTPFTHDCESNTFHQIFDKKNKYIRMKTPENAGVEFRDCDSPCGSWAEMRDNEGRGVLLSKKDKAAIIRDKAVSKDDKLKDIVSAAAKAAGEAAAAAIAAVAGAAGGAAAGAAVGKAGKAAGDKEVDKNKGEDKFDENCKKRTEAPEAVKATKDAAGKEANKQASAAAKAAGQAAGAAAAGAFRGSVDPISNPEVFGNVTEQQTRDAAQKGAEEECERQQASSDMAGESGKVHKKILKLDDDTDYIIIKNVESKGKIRLVANGNIEVIATDVKMEATRDFHINAGRQICMQAGGSQWVVRQGHVGTNGELRAGHVTAFQLTGTHTAIQIPEHPKEPAPRGVNTSCIIDRPEKEESIKGGVGLSKGPKRVSPKEFDKEQGCAPNKILAGPVSPQIRGGGGGGGGGGGSSPPPSPPAPGPNPVPPEIPFVPDPEPEPDNFEELTQGSGTVLWYGTSTEFLSEIQNIGLIRSSFANNENEPPNADAIKMVLAGSVGIARGNGGQVLKPGEDFAALAKKRYGKESLILRIFQVPEPDKLSLVENNPDIFEYTGDVISPDFFDIFEVGTDTFEGTPQFPGIGEEQ